MTDPTDDADPFVRLAAFAELIGATVTESWLAARKRYNAEVGTIISADPAWSVATVDENGELSYLACLGFVVGPDRASMALTAQQYPLRFSAVRDPCSDRHISTFDGKVYRDGMAFLHAMRALRSFLAESDQPRPEMTN